MTPIIIGLICGLLGALLWTYIGFIIKSLVFSIVFMSVAYGFILMYMRNNTISIDLSSLAPYLDEITQYVKEHY